MVTIGVLGWVTSTAVERVGRWLTRWLPRTEYVAGARPRKAPAPVSSVPEPVHEEGVRDEHLV
jgi:NitT/TauT family transport system permease protein